MRKYLPATTPTAIPTINPISGSYGGGGTTTGG